MNTHVQSIRRPGIQILAVCSVVLSTLLVLVWPFFLFMSAFVFDAPLRGKGDETMRFVFVFYLLSYPLGYLVAIGYLIARKIGPPKGQVLLTKRAIFLFLLPFIHLGLLALVLLVGSLLGSQFPFQG
jgi:hypothetical protein